MSTTGSSSVAVSLYKPNISFVACVVANLHVDACERGIGHIVCSSLLSSVTTWSAGPMAVFQLINQSKRKTSYANGQTNLGHKHKAPDHNHEATQPMVDLPHTS